VSAVYVVGGLLLAAVIGTWWSTSTVHGLRADLQEAVRDLGEAEAESEFARARVEVQRELSEVKGEIRHAMGEADDGDLARLQRLADGLLPGTSRGEAAGPGSEA
jgi:hypothetical protein